MLDYYIDKIWSKGKPKFLTISFNGPDTVNIFKYLKELKKELNILWDNKIEDIEPITNEYRKRLNLFNGNTSIIRWGSKDNYFQINVTGKIIEETGKLRISFSIEYWPSFDYGGEMVVKENGIYTYEYFLKTAYTKLKQQITDFLYHKDYSIQENEEYNIS